MRRLRARIACAALLAAGCGAESRRTTAPTEAPTAVYPVADGARAQPVAGYLLNSSAALRSGAAWLLADENGSLDDAGLVLNGARVSARLSPQLGVSDDPPLAGGLRVPEQHGGGFLFWGEHALFLAREFSAPLTRVGWIPDNIVHLASHPKGLLVRFSNGSRGLFEARSLRRLPIALDGMADVQSLGDGRALALLYGGEARISRDSGATWHAPTPALPAPASGVDRLSGSLWLELVNGDTYRLGQDGTLVPAEPPAPIAVTARARNKADGPPLEQVVATGLLLDPRTALVYDQGTIWGVGLPSGSVVFSTPIPAPARSTCELVRGIDQPLLLCVPPSGTVFVYAGFRDGSPGIETVLAAPRRQAMQAAFGVLVWDGGCQAEPVPGHVCVRTREGQWLDRSIVKAIRESRAGDAGIDGGSDGGLPNGTLGKASDEDGLSKASVRTSRAGSRPTRPVRKPSSPRRPPSAENEDGQDAIGVRRWIPTADGNVVAWMDEGSPWHVDAATGVVTAMPGAGFEQANAEVDEPTNRSMVDALWYLDRDGRVRGFRPSEIVEIDPHQGKLPAAPLVGNATWAPPHGIASDEKRRAWQTADSGRTWEPVGELLDARGMRCSEVGCVAGSIVRLGWTSRPFRPPREVRQGAVDRLPSAGRPRLICERSGDGRSLTTTVPNSDSERVAGLGAQSLRIAGVAGGESPLEYVWNPGAQDATSGEGPFVAKVWPADATVSDGSEQPPLRARNRTVQWLSPFDPSAQIHTTPLSGPAFIGALRAAGAPLDSDTAADVSLPVLDASDGKQAALLIRLASPSGMLLLGGRPERAQPFFPALEIGQSEAGNAVSAIAQGRQSVAVLFANEAADQVVVSTSRGSRRDWQVAHVARLPTEPNPPALAIDPVGGLGIVYTPSGRDPASDGDPALVVRKRAPSVRLAPWSTLAPSSAPECQASADDFQLVLTTAARWLDLVDASAPTDDGSGMYAAVRWNEKRVCLVALETRLSPVQYENLTIETRLIARFDKDAAARVAVHQGYELRQPTTCRLEKAAGSSAFIAPGRRDSDKVESAQTNWETRR